MQEVHHQIIDVREVFFLQKLRESRRGLFGQFLLRNQPLYAVDFFYWLTVLTLEQAQFFELLWLYYVHFVESIGLVWVAFLLAFFLVLNLRLSHTNHLPPKRTFTLAMRCLFLFSVFCWLFLFLLSRTLQPSPDFRLQSRTGLFRCLHHFINNKIKFLFEFSNIKYIRSMPTALCVPSF